MVKQRRKMTDHDDDDDTAEMLEEFQEEHGRVPHSSHEFQRWYIERAKRMARSINAQLEAQGLKVVDGKIVPK
jgi:hypothetical protein